MLYKFGKFLCSVIFRPIYHIKIHGKEKVPKSGPVIICSNHISNIDPLIVGITSPRVIHFMAKEELFKNNWIGWILKNVNAFPVKRGFRDRNALRKGLAVLEEKHVLGLFPEGTRSKDGQPKKGLAGAGFFALRSGAPVVPCAILGPYQKFKPLHVIYGEPMDIQKMIEEDLSAQEVTDRIMEEIQNLINTVK
ncbi:lysophospholipid acyltransferase family protein [Bacillaceae bacterium S4-13-58]